MRIQNDLKLAVLIDADNVPYAKTREMLDEIAKFGVPTIKRIYGDWTKPTVSGWKPILLENAITPVQQYSYTTGKNATDSAMIIDAMDILHSGKVDGFCLVSSDSDFTRLATRLRESGMFVLGLGEQKTPKPFIVACDKFIYVEILSEEEDGQSSAVSEKSKSKSKTKYKVMSKNMLKLIKQTINDLADDKGWASLSEIGSLLNKKKNDFDPRIYGFHKLSEMFVGSPEYEIQEREGNSPGVRHIYIRCITKKKSKL